MKRSRLLAPWTLVIAVVALQLVAVQAAPFTIVALPDTQNYCNNDTLLEGYKAQTTWAVNNVAARNIKLVAGLGDIVNHGGNSSYWARADTAMDILDTAPGLPYAAPLGNHDYDSPGNMGGGATNYVANFGAARYAGKPWYGGSSPDELNHYQTFYADGREYLHLALEYDARNSSIAWAQGILAANADKPTILSTHDYLSPSGTRPTGASAGGNSPEQIYQQLVHNNSQVFMVLCGHYHGESQLTSTNAAGQPVYQMLADYQMWPNGGDGWLRTIELDETNSEIRVQTYTPGVPANPTPRYMTGGDSQFTLPLDFTARFGAPPHNVEAGNIDIVQNWLQYDPPHGWGDKSSATVTVPEGTPGFSMPDWNTGDYYPAVDGQRIDLNDGILLATVRNNGRDNGDGLGTRYATVETTSLNTPWGGNAFLATNPAGNDNAGGDELNVDLAAAWLPFAREWTGAHVNGATIRASSTDVSAANLTNSATGVWQLALPGVDTRSDGLVFANGGGNSNNFTAAGAVADGSRFDIQLRDNYSSGLENSSLGFAYIPYDSENITMGRVSGVGGLYNKAGEFSIQREGVGTFRLTIAGQSPTTGMLLLSADSTSIASDNIMSYEADGGDFIIQTRDVNNAAPTAPQDIGSAPAFGFAFIPFATPPTGPGRRTFDPAAQVAAANLRVIEHGSGDAATNLHVEVAEGTGHLTTPLWTRADYQVYQNGTPMSASDGVMIASVRENGRLNPATAADTRYAIAATAPAGGTWQVSTYWAGYPTWPGEFNVDTSVAYFPFAAGWQGGRASNAANNAEMAILEASPDIVLGANFIDVASPAGQYQLSLMKNGGADPVDARADGIVFACGGKDENNFAAAGPSSDGSHFVLQTRDSDAGGTENDPISFAYIPYDTPNVAMGRVSGVGGLYNKSGDFTLRREGVGVYRLSIPGQDASTGTLLLTPDSGSIANDNIISYQADGSDFIIEQRDVNHNVVPWLQEVGNAPAFNFAFIPFDNPPSAPGVRNFDPTARIAAANVQITEINPGANAGDMHAQVTEGSGYLTTPTFTRGQVALCQNGVPLDASAGVLLGTIRDHLRDNSATGGKSDYGVLDVYTSGGGYSVSTRAADPVAQQTHNIDFAVAYIPDALGFATGASVPIPGGSTTLTIPGAGDTRRSGVLMATAYGNDDNYANVQPLSDGSGWTVEVRDNGSGLEGDSFNYAFLPYGTDNLVAGQVDWYGYIQNKTGSFSLAREGTGLYRLSIPGETPSTGMLLLTGTKGNWSSDNIAVYRPDGDDFLIQGLDTQSNNTHAPQDTDFNFAFISFDNPPANPQLRTIDPNALAAANIRVIQHDTGNSATSVSAWTPEGTPGMTVNKANKGSYWLSVDGAPLDADAGVLISSVRENGRDNGDGDGLWHCQSSTARDGATYYVETHRASAGLYATTEHNIDTAAVYFPFSGGWQAGHATNSVNGGAITSLVATPGIGLGSEFIDNGNGQFELRLPGVDALSDGLVFANHGKNEGNYAMAGPSSDGSHFAIKVHDDGVNGGSFEQDPVAFAYIPYDTAGVAMGRVSHEGGLYNKAGDFTIRREGVGTFRLSIPGQTPTTGALLVTGDAFDSTNDNLATYQADGSDWILQTRDLNANPPPTQDQFNYAALQFAFIPFDSAPTAPGGRVFDPTAQVAAANIRVIQNTTGGGSDALHCEVAEGTGFLTAAYWNRGDFQLRQNGRVIDGSAGVLLASMREDARNDAGEAANGIGLVDVNYAVAFGGINAPGTVTHRAGNSYGGEFNVDHAVAYFPFAQGWQGGLATGNDGTANGPMQAVIGSPGLAIGTHVIDNPATNGLYEVFLPGSGDTRRSGPLFVCAAENDNNAATVVPKTNGSGWDVQVRDNTSTLENEDFTFVFMPYGTTDMVGGEVAEGGTLANSTGNFYAYKSGTGTYRMTVPGGSPDKGMLLLSPVASTGINQDNMLTYEADGDEFVIRAYDLGNAQPTTMQDTRFFVSYISFDNPPTDPKLRVVDPMAVAAANVRITQNDTSGGSSSVTVTTPQSTPGFYMSHANTGDFYPALDGSPTDLNQGILMAGIRNNGRDNGGGLQRGSVEAATDTPTSPWLASSVAGADNSELNIDLAAAYFPFAGGWVGAHVDATGDIWASRQVDSSMLSKISTGRYRLDLPGVDSFSDGTLFAIGGSNSNRVVTAAVLGDGGWELSVRGNNQDGGSYLDDDFSILYVPYGLTRNVVSGLVGDDGSLLNGQGLTDADIIRLATGEYRLTIPGGSPEDGILLLTVAKKWADANTEDNVLSYEAAGADFLIQSFDLPGVTPQDTQFVFAFIPFDEPVTVVPEPASLALLGAGLLVLLRRRRSTH